MMFALGSIASLNNLVDILGVKGRIHGRGVVQFIIDCTSAQAFEADQALLGMENVKSVVTPNVSGLMKGLKAPDHL